MGDIALLVLGLALFHGAVVVALNTAFSGTWIMPRRQFRSLLFIASAWLLLQIIVAILLIWPIWGVQQTHNLTSALALSLAGGLVTLGLQRIWPNWAYWQRDVGNGWPTLNRQSQAFRFWRSTMAGLVMLILALPVLAVIAKWTNWPGGQGVWMAGYVALAFLWHVATLKVPVSVQDLTTSAEVVKTVIAPEISIDPDLQLLHAAQNGQVEQALEALERGANANQLPTAGARDQRSLMMIAASLSDLRLLRALIGKGVDVNAAHGKLNPLLNATRDSWHGRAEAVTMLLANGAHTDVTDADGNTPLHHAMRSTDAAVAALLMDAGADKEAVNSDGYTPLALACQAANWRLARYMLERKAKIEPEHAEPVLLAAASAEDDDIGIRLLHKHKARIDIRGKQQRTALMTAAHAGLLEVTAVLLELGAQINAEDENGQTAFMLAAQSGEVEVLKKLLESPKLNRQATDSQGKTALDHALSSGRWSAVAAIDPSYPLPEHLSREPERAQRVTGSQQLFHVLEAKDFTAAQQLLDVGLVPDNADMSDLLFSFCQQDNKDAVHWLCRHGGHLFCCDNHGQSVYSRLLQTRQNPSAFINTFMADGQSISGSGTLAMYLEFCLNHDFSRRADEQLALQLLQQGADAFGASIEGSPPLHLCVRMGWQRLGQSLLDLGVDPNAVDVAGLTALHYAAQLGRFVLLKELLISGADPERRAANGQSPLGLALLNSDAEVQHWLDWSDWQLPKRRLNAGDLISAVLVKDQNAVKRLLALAVPVNGFDSKGSTALIHACGQGQLSIVQMLISHGAKVDDPAANGVTPLWAAISQGHEEVLLTLLEQQVNVNQSVAGFTPLILACRSGRVEMAGRLLECGADISACDTQEQTALHAAAAFLVSDAARLDSVVLIDTLFRAGSEVASADKFGQTVMHLLCGAGLQKGQVLKEGLVLSALDRVFQESPQIDTLDARGFTALHHAAARGYSQLAVRLLRAGADKNLRDNLGRSAYDFAVMGGFAETADLLQDKPERIDIASLLVRKDQA